jgi:signal peptidase I
MKKLKPWLSTLLIAIVLGLGINSFALSSVKVGASVLNEYNVGDRLFINKLSHNYAVGQIIV